MVAASRTDNRLERERVLERARAKEVKVPAVVETKAADVDRIRIRIGSMRSGGITGGDLHHLGSDSTHQMRLPWQSP